MQLPQAARELVDSAPPAHLVTLDAGAGPAVTMVSLHAGLR